MIHKILLQEFQLAIYFRHFLEGQATIQGVHKKFGLQNPDNPDIFLTFLAKTPDILDPGFTRRGP